MNHFIFEEYRTPTKSLGIYRIFFAVYALTYVPKALWVASFPDSFFNPPIGFTIFLTGFCGLSFLLAANAVAIIAAVFLLFGYRTRLASITFAFSMFMCSAWNYSLGKIDHDITLIFVPLVMQFAEWGHAYSLDSLRQKRNTGQEETTAWPLALMALIIGLTMMSAALPKAFSGWLDLHSHAVRGHLLNNVVVTGRANWFADQMLRIQSGLFWELADYGTVIVEAAFLLTVFSRRAFLIVCALACFFHLGIALSMQIAFASNIVAYASIADWSVVEAHGGGALRLWNRLLDRVSPLFVFGFGTATAILFLRFGNPLKLPQSWDPLGVAICLLAAMVAAVFLFGLLRDWGRNCTIWLHRRTHSNAKYSCPR